jgi:hypothetical protein
VREVVRLESLRALDPQRPRIYFFQDGAKYLMRQIVITKHFSADDVRRPIENGIKLANAYEKWRRESGEE